MTYCIGLYTRAGLVMLADTRTNAGVDNISTFRKLKVWEAPGDRVISLMSAGNLAVSQTVIGLLDEGLLFTEEDRSMMGVDAPADPDQVQTPLTVPTMFQAAMLVGRAVRAVFHMDGEALEKQDSPFNVSMILGGQVAGRRMRLFNVYSAGNFIEASEDTPFFQIGEHKYGKPILDRAMSYDLELHDAVKLSLLSMDSTMRSNLTVGMPLDLMVYQKDSLKVGFQRRIEQGDDYYVHLQQSWSDSLRGAYTRLPQPEWMNPDLFSGK